MRWVTATLVGLMLAAPVHAQEPVTQEREHVVRKGDTLWDLAGFYFSNPFQWRTIYSANTMVVEDPHWIYPDEVLLIPGIAGDTEPEPDVRVRTAQREPLRTVFYQPPPTPAPSEQEPTVLSEPGLRTFPVKPGEFASAPYLMDPDDLEVKARFMRSIREESQGSYSSVHPQDRIYLAYVRGSRPSVGERLALVDVQHHVNGAARGDRVIHPKAVVRIIALEEDVVEAQIEAQYGPVYPERQLIVPMDMFPDFRTEMAEPVEGGYDLEGVIIDFMDDQPMYGRSSLGFLNVGARHGVREGDIFRAYLPERAVRERRAGEFRTRIERLPEEEVADLRVVRVTENYATVKVDDVKSPRLQAELPVRRIRRIP